jgi:hypothetical protein
MSYYIEFIAVMFLAVCWIWGFEYLFKDGEILGRPGKWMNDNLAEWITKPTMACKYCMSSLHGTIFFVVFLRDYPWWMWPMFCVCCCGMTGIFDKKE